MKKITAIIVAICGLAAFAVNAQTYHFNAADESVAFRIYNGYADTLTVVITNSGAENDISFTVGSDENEVDGSGNTDTIAEIQAAIVALTNGWTGGARLTVDASTSLGTDSTDGELLNGTYTAASGEWLSVLWDTSVAKFYQVSFNDEPQFDYAGNEILKNRARAGKFTIDRIYGEPTGTGNVTLSIYLDGSLAWQKTYESPYYVLGAGGTNAAVNTITIDEAPGIPVGPQQGAIVRATRATTATTGNIGVIANQ